MTDLGQYDPLHILNMISSLQTQINELRQDVVRYNSGGEAVPNTGTQQVGLLVSKTDESTSSDPTDPGFSGAFFSGNGLTFADLLIFIGGVLGGTLRAGFGTNGQLVGMGGNWRLDENGQQMTGLQIPIKFTATNAGEERDGLLGMYLPQGATIPVWSVQFSAPAGASLMTNGDAETGDGTGWTNSTANAWVAYATNPYAGSWSFRHDPTVDGCPATYTQNVAGLTAGNIYGLSFASKLNSGILSPFFKLVWKTGGGATVQTDTMLGNHNTGYVVNTQNFTCPATATNVDVVIYPGDPFNDCQVDNITFALQTLTREVGFFPNFRIVGGPLELQEQATPGANPATGFLAIYPKADHNPWMLDVNGNENIMALHGWIPYAYPAAFDPTAAFATALALAANGASLAVPIFLKAPMLLESVSVRNTDATLARTWGWDLYEQYLNSGQAAQNTLQRIALSNGNESFTAAAASTRTLGATSAPVFLAPGLYWLVVQSRHATNTFGVGTTAASAAFAVNTSQTKTTTNPNGATLDFVAATWAKRTDIAAVRLNGRVFGQTAAF